MAKFEFALHSKKALIKAGKEENVVTGFRDADPFSYDKTVALKTGGMQTYALFSTRMTSKNVIPETSSANSEEHRGKIIAVSLFSQ